MSGPEPQNAQRSSKLSAWGSSGGGIGAAGRQAGSSAGTGGNPLLGMGHSPRLFGGPFAPLLGPPPGRGGLGGGSGHKAESPLAKLAEEPKKLADQPGMPGGVLMAATIAKEAGPPSPSHDPPTVMFTGITNGQSDADAMSRKLAATGGYANPRDPHAVAAYGDFHDAPPLLGSGDTARNIADAALDVNAVRQYFTAAEGIQVDKNGQLVIDEKTRKGLDSQHNNLGEKYASATELGQQGAQQALSQMKPAPSIDPKTGKVTDEKAANQFISLLGHSGGGQSSFYSAIDLYQKGFKNIAINGYEMAMSPHQREVLEKLGIKVTNISGHLGDGAQVDSLVGEGLKDAVGKGDPNYYDVSLKMEGKNPAGLHSIGDKAASMMMYSAWLDSQGRHQQFNDKSYAEWQKATGAQYAQDQQSAPKDAAAFNRPSDLMDGARFNHRIPVQNNLLDERASIGIGPLTAGAGVYAGGSIGNAQGSIGNGRASGSVDNAAFTFGADAHAGGNRAASISGGASVGHADGAIDLNRGTASGSVDNARAQLSYGTTTPGGPWNLLGFNDRTTMGAGVDHASGNLDLAHGRASGEFQNASLDYHKTSGIRVFGNDLNVTYGGHLNATGGGSVDAAQGRAQGNINLAGSSLDLGPLHLQAGDWAQAQGGVDLRQGAANLQLGGRNGVGADMNLAQGNLDLNVLGHKIDVDQGIRNGANWVGDRVSDIGNGLSNLASHIPW